MISTILLCPGFMFHGHKYEDVWCNATSELENFQYMPNTSLCACDANHKYIYIDIDDVFRYPRPASDYPVIWTYEKEYYIFDSRGLQECNINDGKALIDEIIKYRTYVKNKVEKLKSKWISPIPEEVRKQQIYELKRKPLQYPYGKGDYNHLSHYFSCGGCQKYGEGGYFLRRD